MKVHVYIAKPGRIISQSYLIWLIVVIQVGANVMLISKMKGVDQVYGIVFINLVLSSLTIPAVQLFINYYKYAVRKK